MSVLLYSYLTENLNAFIPFQQRDFPYKRKDTRGGKHYQIPELLKINTLENAIYLSVKNDVSFVIDARLSLYEHQSTYSPNLPLRFLFYISSEYSAMTRDANLYGTQIVKISPPQFIIFYNGEKEQPERKVLKLSDMYTVQEEEICQGDGAS